MKGHTADASEGDHESLYAGNSDNDRYSGSSSVYSDDQGSFGGSLGSFGPVPQVSNVVDVGPDRRGPLDSRSGTQLHSGAASSQCSDGRGLVDAYVNGDDFAGVSVCTRSSMRGSQGDTSASGIEDNPFLYRLDRLLRDAAVAAEGQVEECSEISSDSSFRQHYRRRSV